MPPSTPRIVLPPRLVVVTGYKQMADVATGELLRTADHKSVLLDDVLSVPQKLFPAARFELMLKRDGTLVSAVGPVAARRLETAYPGSATYGDILEAEHALRSADLTRGFSPAGRALDLATRRNPKIKQWRVKAEFMQAFQGALYGGVQFGGAEKPDMTKPPIGQPGMGWYHADIASSYPYLATYPLPTVASAFFERGYRPRATLIRISAEQRRPVLWRRGPHGEPYQDDWLTGWYVAEEITWLEAHGIIAQLDVEASLSFGQGDRYLADVIEHLYPLKEAEKFPPRKLVLKSALNGLIGKFAFRLSPWRPLRGDEDAGRTRLEVGANMLVFDREQAEQYPRTSNVIWTALTNARARVRLWQKVLEIEQAGGDVLWAHTDAVVALVPDSYSPRESGAALGQWRTLVRTYSQTGRKQHDDTQR